MLHAHTKCCSIFFSHTKLKQTVCSILEKGFFKDRLDWAVNCTDEKEIDAYDTHDANYILGKFCSEVICGLRFIEIDKPNMLKCGVFNSFFNNIKISSGNYLEASRLFIDKDRINKLNLSHHPICALIFVAMINFTRKNNYDGIYSIASEAMLTIYRRTGWNVEVLESGHSEKGEAVHYIFMPVDKSSTDRILKK
ncbi:acyl-homoserine-lactone synthase [Pantoea cypripedii]|uniref:acyl-homoserine-lactone synthase n=1 Tax=Pantoea cypripedii TaxID=55209 RepID=UPI000A0FC775